MNPALLERLRDPDSGRTLNLRELETDGDSIREGLLFEETSHRVYPIIGGVPYLLESAAPASFIHKYADALSGYTLKTAPEDDWSFSREWSSYFEHNLERTWGWSVDQRIEQFFLETQTDPDTVKGSWVLDAGCGNGLLTDALAGRGANVVGLDYSSSVLEAEVHRKNPKASFARGDLQRPPLATESFDIVISNGVLHHTPNTYETFKKVAALVRPGGRFYLWLYRRPETFLRRHIVYGGMDFTRLIVSRLPGGMQRPIVRGYARSVRAMHWLRRRHRNVRFEEQVISAYDTLTPTWRHYHTPVEVSRWFFESGFSDGVLTHWDNRYGFGMLATRTPRQKTPGTNFA